MMWSGAAIPEYQNLETLRATWIIGPIRIGLGSSWTRGKEEKGREGKGREGKGRERKGGGEGGIKQGSLWIYNTFLQGRVCERREAYTWIVLPSLTPLRLM